jgi:hypothetical protein
MQNANHSFEHDITHKGSNNTSSSFASAAAACAFQTRQHTTPRQKTAPISLAQGEASPPQQSADKPHNPTCVKERAAAARNGVTPSGSYKSH